MLLSIVFVGVYIHDIHAFVSVNQKVQASAQNKYEQLSWECHVDIGIGEL